MENNSFQDWQADYAAHGIATFPVKFIARPNGKFDKKPMVSRYERFGIRGSSQIARKYPDASAFGFVAGRRNGVTVGDVDEIGEKPLQRFLDRHGSTPVISRTASGKHHAWYRYNGERRVIRPEPRLNVDILGGGVVVAPPSRGAGGEYQFIAGNLDDLDRLPVMQNVPVEAWDNSRLVAEVKQGQRNNKLFVMCLDAARHCDDFEALCDVATTRNSEFFPPLEDDEVMRTAASAWKYETEGRNYIGGMRAVFCEADVLPLMADPHVGMLVVWAKARFKPDSQFWIADGLAETFGWSLRQLREARRRAIKMGLFILIRPGSGFGGPGLYRWGLRGRRLREKGVC